MAWQAILRAIGGGMQGAANGLNQQIARPAPGENHSANRLDDNSAAQEIGAAAADALGGAAGKVAEEIGKVKDKNAESGSAASGAASGGATGGYQGAASSGEFAGTGIQQLLGGSQGKGMLGGLMGGGAGKAGGMMKMCDEETKAYFEKRGVSDDYEKICSYVFKYKPAIQQEFSGHNGIDGDTHVGIMAQELAQLPSTQATVSTDAASGYLQVDTQELTLSNTAAIGELARRVAELEKTIGAR